jgi:hypothetical protein
MITGINRRVISVSQKFYFRVQRAHICLIWAFCISVWFVSRIAQNGLHCGPTILPCDPTDSQEHSHNYTPFVWPSLYNLIKHQQLCNFVKTIAVIYIPSCITVLCLGVYEALPSLQLVSSF